jgi:hypothetical protein
MRPVVSSGPSRASDPAERELKERAGRQRGSRDGDQTAGKRSSRARASARGAGGPNAVRVRRLARGADDGFSSPLVPGLKSSEDADRLAAEIAFASHRLTVMEDSPVGLWADVAGGEDIEERSWLAFLIAFVGIGDRADGADPFAAVGSAWVTWAAVNAGDEPRFEGIERGPRGAYEPGRGGATIDAYRAWVERSGSQRDAYSGEGSWSAERRFERVFERLALPGLHRDARFELLVTLGRLGVYELGAGKLQLAGENETTWAAKRALGIGDTILLERRAAELADAVGAPLEALDLAFHNWGSGVRFGDGIDPEIDVGADCLERIRDALGL